METPAPPASLPPILELKPGAPVVVRRARRWGVRLAILSVLALIGAGFWFGFWHLLAFGRLQSRGANISWRNDDSALKGFLAINTSSPYAFFRLADADLESLRDMFWVRSLDLSRCDGITDEAMGSIASVKPLRELFLSRMIYTWNPNDKTAHGPAITDAGLARIRGLKELQTLSLDGTLITDAGLVNLSGMTRLDTLDLSNTAITDAGLAHLKGLKMLRFLRLEGTKVTCEGRSDFLATSPDVEILLPKCNIDQPAAEPMNKPTTPP